LQLLKLGYQAAVLCDNDTPKQLTPEDIEAIRSAGAHVCHWESCNSTERQLFADLPWEHIPALLAKISEHHDTLELASIIDLIRKEPQAVPLNLGTVPEDWHETPELRQLLGDLTGDGKWIKRMEYAAKAFRFALPLLPASCTLQLRLDELWTWVQRNE
jgi:putative ATP-dependent endonuclease of the OLD family